MLILVSLSLLTTSVSAGSVSLQSWVKPFVNDSSRRTFDYQWESKTTANQRICAIIPSSGTSYWFAVNYGLVKKARALGVSLKVYALEDGLNDLQQTELVKKCVSHVPHSIIIGADAGDAFNQSIIDNKGKSTIIAVGKNLLGKSVDASSSASYQDVGEQLAKYMNQHKDESSADITVLFPGDKSVPYVNAFVEGFKPNINVNKYQIKDTIYTTNSYSAIKTELANYLNSHLNTSIIIASGRVAQAAVEVLDQMSLSGDVKIISYELSAQVFRDIKRGNISASITNSPVIQGFLAIDMAVKLNNKRLDENHISPKATVVDGDNILDVDISQVFAPYGYRETLEVN